MTITIQIDPLQGLDYEKLEELGAKHGLYTTPRVLQIATIATGLAIGLLSCAQRGLVPSKTLTTLAQYPLMAAGLLTFGGAAASFTPQEIQKPFCKHLHNVVTFIKQNPKFSIGMTGLGWLASRCIRFKSPF